MLIRNVNADKKLKQVLLTSKLEVVRLSDAYHQPVQDAHYMLSFDESSADIRLEEIQGVHKGELQLSVMTPATDELVKSMLHPDIVQWVTRDDFQYRTLPKPLRPTLHTLQEEGHVSKLGELLMGLPIPTGLRTLIIDHRLNVDWFDQIQYQNIAVLNGPRVRVEKAMSVDPSGRRKPVSTSWIVYYAHRSAGIVNTQTRERSLSLRHALRAIEITHNTLATDENPWLSFKVYERVTAVK